jgi:transcriptional regulator with XRE-family HTH domain
MKELININEMDDLTEVEIDHEKLKAARGKLTPTQVAGVVGVTPQQIWNIENGVKNPSGNLLARLCLLYGVDLRELLIDNAHAA